MDEALNAYKLALDKLILMQSSPAISASPEEKMISTIKVMLGREKRS